MFFSQNNVLKKFISVPFLNSKKGHFYLLPHLEKRQFSNFNRKKDTFKIIPKEEEEGEQMFTDPDLREDKIKYGFGKISPVTKEFILMMRENLKARNYKGAVRVYQNLVKTGSKPNLSTNNLLLSAFTKLRQIDNAEKLGAMMLESGEYDIVTLNTLMSLRARKFIPELLDETWKLLRKKSEPDRVSYLIYIKSCCSMMLVSDAERRAGELKELLMEAVPSMIQMYSMAKLYERADRLMERVELEKHPWSIQYATALVRSFGERKDFEKIKQIINRVIELEMRPDSIFYNGLIEAYGNEGKFEEVETFVNDLVELGLGMEKTTFHTLIAAYSRHQRWEEVHRYLEMFHVKKHIPNAITYNMLMKGRLDAGHPNKVLRYFQEAVSHNVEVNANSYAFAMKALLETNRTEVALRMWDKSKDFPNSNKFPLYFSCAIETLLRMDKKEDAKKEVIGALACPAFVDSTTIQLALENFESDPQVINPLFKMSTNYPHIATPQIHEKIQNAYESLSK